MSLLYGSNQLLILMSIFGLIFHFNDVSNDSAQFDSKLEKEFKESEAKPEVKFVANNGRSLRYIEVDHGESTAPAFIFVHGAPGGADAFFEYLKDSSLFSHALMISVDRLGYAGSAEGGAEPSIIMQAEAIEPLVQEFSDQGRKVYLIGHSYGGPVIARLAMSMGDRVEGIMMLAPAIDPQNEKQFWFARLGIVAPTKWITPKAMQIAAYEKLRHVESLIEIEDRWNEISCEVIHMHGDRDMLVPSINLAYSQKMLTSADYKPIVLNGENHFLPWTQQDRIKALLKDWM